MPRPIPSDPIPSPCLKDLIHCKANHVQSDDALLRPNADELGERLRLQTKQGAHVHVRVHVHVHVYVHVYVRV